MDRFFNDGLVWIVLGVLLFGAACYVYGAALAIAVTAAVVVVIGILAGWN